jgi:hypothetical protein
MSPPTKEIIPVGKTLLGEVEPMSESERKEMLEKDLREWKDKSLIEIIYYACTDRKFAKKLCEKVASYSSGDHDLVKIIKKYAVAGSGKYPQTPPGWNIQLLWHYAYLMEDIDIEDYKKREHAAIDDLIRQHENITGRKISYEAMQNKISASIKAEGISDKPEWVQKVINNRKDRGKGWNKI